MSTKITKVSITIMINKVGRDVQLLLLVSEIKEGRLRLVDKSMLLITYKQLLEIKHYHRKKIF